FALFFFPLLSRPPPSSTLFPYTTLFRSIVLRALSLNVDNACSTTLLDLQRGPSPLSLGHAFRKRKRDVAWGGGQAGRHPRAQTGAQRRPRAVLPLGAGARALFDRGGHPGSLFRPARPQGQESGGRPAGVRKAAPPGHAGRDRKSTRLNSSHVSISYAVFCLKKK